MKSRPFAPPSMSHVRPTRPVARTLGCAAAMAVAAARMGGSTVRGVESARTSTPIRPTVGNAAMRVRQRSRAASRASVARSVAAARAVRIALSRFCLNGNPDEDHPVCCKSSGGTICEHNKPGPADDRCCYDDQLCVKGKCCCDGCEGAVKCGGKCCAKEACCNGKCCEKGYVCATKNIGAIQRPASEPTATVVPLRTASPAKPASAANAARAFASAIDGAGNEFCCGARRYCVFQGPTKREVLPDQHQLQHLPGAPGEAMNPRRSARPHGRRREPG